ncbi:MAG: serine hydrolase [Asticcacaulis sp.]
MVLRKVILLLSCLTLGAAFPVVASLPAPPADLPAAPVAAPAAEATPAPAEAATSSAAAPRRAAPRPRAPVVATPAPPAADTRPVSPADIEAFSDTLIPTLMQRDQVLGVTVAVIQGQTPVLIKGYGYDRLSPRRPVDPQTSLFRLGSVTKTFTWVVTRQEMEAGRIGLDDPLSKTAPGGIFREDNSYKPLRLRDILAHTEGYEETSLGHLFQLRPDTLEAADSYLRRHAPKRVRERGQFASYSNYGTALIARTLVDTARAKDVPTLMETRIFTPLGLNHTTLREPYDPAQLNPRLIEGALPAPMSAELTNKTAQGFVWDGAAWRAQPYDHALPMSGALGGSSTAGDMARFMSLMLRDGQLDGVQLYDSQSAKAFRTPLLAMPNGYNGWASGLMMRETPQGLATYGHSGATLWFNANMILIPELDIGIFIAANTPSSDRLTRAYPELLIRHIEGIPPTAPVRAAPSNADYSRVTGSYVSTRRAYGGLEGAITRLINTVEISTDDQGHLLAVGRDQVSAFVPATAADFFVPVQNNPLSAPLSSESLHFLLPASGKATAFETGSNMGRYELVDWAHKPQTLTDMTRLMLGLCVLVLMGFARHYNGHERPTPYQTLATWASYALAVLWISAIWVFYDWKNAVGNDPAALFIDWPSGQVKLASGLALMAALGTLAQLFYMPFVFREARFHSDGWAIWQKGLHLLLITGWLAYATLLAAWGALEPWSR